MTENKEIEQFYTNQKKFFESIYSGWKLKAKLEWLETMRDFMYEIFDKFKGSE